MWEICKDLQDEIVTMRRDLHQIPEIGETCRRPRHT